MTTDLATVRQRLRTFADDEVARYSPLYAHLAARAAEDGEVAGLLTAARDADATPTLLLAAAHRLVIAEPVSDIADYYPSVGGTNGVDGRVWEIFRRFVLDRADRMRELVGSRVTQTNEVGRAAAAYPAVAMAAREAGGRIGLLEIGCSAGLLLALDSYGYRYTLAPSDQITAGPTRAPLVLGVDLALADGAGKPRVPKKLTVGARVGLDKRPIDVRDEDELAWLEACIWADQPERLRRFGLAASMLSRTPPELVAGDAVDDLAAAAERVPESLPLVVLTSHVLCYLGDDGVRRFTEALGELGARRPLWWVYQESDGDELRHVPGARGDLGVQGTGTSCAVGIVRYAGGPSGRVDGELLAAAAAQGDTLRWLA